MVPQLLRKEPALKLSAWGHIECYVQGEGIGEDKYHTAQNTLKELDNANIPIDCDMIMYDHPRDDRNDDNHDEHA